MVTQEEKYLGFDISISSSSEDASNPVYCTAIEDIYADDETMEMNPLTASQTMLGLDQLNKAVDEEQTKSTTYSVSGNALLDFDELKPGTQYVAYCVVQNSLSSNSNPVLSDVVSQSIVTGGVAPPPPGPDNGEEPGTEEHKNDTDSASIVSYLLFMLSMLL